MEASAFKQILSQWASGVTVVTTRYDHKPIGITASAFNSVSVEPPLILICLAQKLFTHKVILETGFFAVNILSAQQTELAKRFAGMIPTIQDRFEGIEWSSAQTSAPILSGVMGWLDCRVKHAYEAGDHSIIVGEVVAGSNTEGDEPLLYFQRRWGQFLPQETFSK